MQENSDHDVTDRIFYFFRDLLDSVQEEFNKLLTSDSHKKRFVWALFALLLNTKGD